MDNSDGQESLLMVSHGNDATWYLLREFWTASWDGTGEIIFNGSSAFYQPGKPSNCARAKNENSGHKNGDTPDFLFQDAHR